MKPENEMQVIGSFDVHNPEVRQWISTHAFKFAQYEGLKVNSPTADAFRVTLADGLDAGETIPQLAARVREVFGPEMTKSVSEMIARTESARAELGGRQEQWKAENAALAKEGLQPLFTGKVWCTAPDCCEFCAQLEGKVVGIGDTFANVGDQITLPNGEAYNVTHEDVETPPLHPNCRCSLEAEMSPVYTQGGL